jgi:hypothetical protein
VFFWLDRRARRRSGEPVRSLDPRSLVRGRRSALWIVPLGLVLIVPVAGIAEKVVSASKVVLNPSYSLGTWAGDLSGYFPENQFLSLDSTTTLFIAAPFLLAGIFLALRRRPRPLAWGLAAVLGFAVLAAAVFRARAFGYYFHFKVLAFVGPLAVVIATAGFSRLRRLGPVLITLFLLTASVGAQDEISATFNQLPQAVLALRGIDRSLPPHSSIRLDINPQSQLWPGFLLYHHPLCSQHPLMHTSYPHVPISRKADFILVNHDMRPPSDAAGPALASVGQYVLYRERASVPGPSLCSQRMVQTVTTASS